MAHVFLPRASWKPRPEWRSISPDQKWFSWGDCRVSTGKDPDGAWHLSISCEKRNPTWEEIKQARYDLLPNDIHIAMLFPPKEQWVNLHEFCFHLHQIFPEEMKL